jgi:hypothetical protein
VQGLRVGDHSGRNEPTTGEINCRNIFRAIHMRVSMKVLGLYWDKQAKHVPHFDQFSGLGRKRVQTIENPQLELAYDYVQWTGKHLFLTGKAGTGKTTFLRSLQQRCTKRMIVVAPTGVAAINAGGVTIHSFFQMPFGPIVPSANGIERMDSHGETLTRRFSRTKINIIRGLDLLVIDEISMVRADLLDGIDAVLRRYRERDRPFGGVQLLMIGDLQQLPPVIKDEDWALLREHYQTGFFFGSLALQQTQFVSIELKHIYRQKDARFIDLLNRVRENRMDGSTCQELNRRYRPDFTPDDSQGYITLTTHNAQAKQTNDAKLEALKTRSWEFTANVAGDFPEYMFPTESNLKLKVGAQVMFVKNDISREKRYFNGKIGTLTRCADDAIEVQCPDDPSPILVERDTWENTKYTINEATKEIQADVAGVFTQYPLKLAWAITIHKSQGLTFERAIVDARAAFAHGQVYVALSRCTTLEGLVLSTPIQAKAVKSDTEILSFTSEIERNQPDSQQLAQHRYAYQQQLLFDLFSFRSYPRLLSHIIKRVRESGNTLPEKLLDRFLEVDREVRKHIGDVAETFHAQLQTLTADHTQLIETNAFLQERVQKGCVYFVDKLNSLLLDPLEVLAVETDNKAVRKSVEETIEALLARARLEVACLTACAAGFSSKTYLKVRAEAAIDVREARKRRKSRADAGLADVAHPELYKRMHQWRERKADQKKVAPNTILPRKVMVGIADRVPVTKSQLKRVRGVGKQTMLQVGDELLALLKEYTSKHDTVDSAETNRRRKREVSETQQLSFDLFQQGKTVADVATARGLAPTTIETHLGHFVGTGELPLDRFVSAEKSQPVMDYFKQADALDLAPAKEHFGDAYSWGELKMIVQHLIHQGGPDG